MESQQRNIEIRVYARFRNNDAIGCEHHEKASNDQCPSAHPGSNGQTDFWVRRGSAMANRIGFLAGWDGPPRRARGKLSKRITRIRGNHQLSTNNEQRTTINDQRSNQFRARRVYAVATWIGAWIWLMVPVTAGLESPGSEPKMPCRICHKPLSTFLTKRRAHKWRMRSV